MVLLFPAGGAAPADAPRSLRHGASHQGSASSLAASCPAWTQQRDQVLGEEEARTGERTVPRSLCAEFPRAPGRGPSSITLLSPSIMAPAPALWSKRPRAEGKGQVQRHPEGQAGLWPHWKAQTRPVSFLSRPGWCSQDGAMAEPWTPARLRSGTPDTLCRFKGRRGTLGGRPGASGPGVEPAHVLLFRGFTGELISPTAGW